MPDPCPHPASLDLESLLRDCELRRQRRSGPGGQHRNKVETGIIIRHCPTGIEASATERRSQEQNRRVAIRRLRVNLAVRRRTPVDPKRSPSPLWQSRCKNGRLSVNRHHEDFPALLAEAMNIVMDRDCDLQAAAEHLGCTRSQLTKLLKMTAEAIQQVNQRRVSQGLSALK